ncbi:hypothetical protein K7X08_030614 [Anisodus acutangulus]|uniref:Ribosomal protein eL8/eL30/eS12/Gadd45 domain-containing protein n=1 Tax=Anisodus acutangulus TaxID=402998 RepID=A0A9Q1L506_9SOLA|nr:hypothetical protein K7X08_030614 [Anisodus acutangulus]
MKLNSQLESQLGGDESGGESIDHSKNGNGKETTQRKETTIKVMFIASDCNPRLLTNHLESLAYSKNVPVVFVKDKKRG